MRINNNISALNAWRQLNNTDNSITKSLERLSSGLRINRAADDAAGLAISEKMRGQVRGLNQAIRNAQDGISMIQTAEGALNETHAILQRMRELATQSANDTNTETDRKEIQKEVDQLAAELTRIARTTEFNTQTLLDGSLDVIFHIGANSNQNMNLVINDMGADALGVAGSQTATFEETAAITPGSDEGGNTAVNFANGSYNVVAIDDYKGTDLVADNVESDIGDVTHVMVDASGEAVGTSTNGTEFHAYGNAQGNATRANVTFLGTPVGEITIEGNAATANVGITDHGLNTGTYTIVDVSNHAVYGDAGNWQVGLADASGNIVALGADDDGDPVAVGSVTQWVDVNDTSSALLSVANTDFVVGDEIVVTGAGIDVSTQATADAAITTINDAIERVSAERSMLGALQNRLEHTIANLGVAAENLQAAESRIRDLDMAQEMMAFTRNQILMQAGTAMLAQANLKPQSVLALLG